MYKPAWYKKEEIKLAEEYFNNDKYQNLDDFIEKHASEIEGYMNGVGLLKKRAFP